MSRALVLVTLTLSLAPGCSAPIGSAAAPGTTPSQQDQALGEAASGPQVVETRPADGPPPPSLAPRLGAPSETMEPVAVEGPVATSEVVAEEAARDPEPTSRPLILDAEASGAAPGRASKASPPVRVATPPAPAAASASDVATGDGAPGPRPMVKAISSGASSSAPFGGESALGSDPESALGALMGRSAGDGHGYGGLGLRGTGRGGGGTGTGTIGLGNIGTIGHGSGGGSGSGYGRGASAGSSRGSGATVIHRGSGAPTRVLAAPAVEAPLRVLTAATVPDADRREAYLDYLDRHPEERLGLGLDLSRRVRFRVIDETNRPVHDALVTVVNAGGQVAGRTRADGYWDLFPSVSMPTLGGAAQVFVQVAGQTRAASIDLPSSGDSRDIHVRFPRGAASGPTVLDLAFVIDVTGSMGDELDYVTEEVVGIVERLRAANPQVRVRVGATLYRDRQDRLPVQQIPFTEDARRFAATLRLVEATGGGDYPEDMNAGLAAALRTQHWSQGQAVRVAVLIADAPPQHYPDSPFTYLNALDDASRRGIRILPVAASGADRRTEYLLRAMGAFTGTPYVYLTDDSGVGSSHMEADTDRIAVEMFSDLLTRLLLSELRGQGMHEPEQLLASAR